MHALIGCIALASFSLFASEKDIPLKTHQKISVDMSQNLLTSSRDIPSYLPRFIELRAVTYRAYPYLYEQNLDDEKEYVAQYVNNDNAVLIVATNGADISGMVIGLPLSTAQDWIKEAFASYSGKIEDIFYVGDLVTSREDSKLKGALLNDLESVLKKQKKFSAIAVCEVYRDECPKENGQIDQYWAGHGYQKHDDLKSVFWWKDHNKSQKTPKTLVYWIKKI